MKQQLAFLKTVENKLKGALGNSKSYGGSGENFNAAVTFTLPDNGHNSRLTDSALWTLGEPTRYVRPDGELDEEDFDEPDDLRGTELLETRIMTTDALREWASSVPEMKEVCPCAILFTIEIQFQAKQLTILVFPHTDTYPFVLGVVQEA